MDCDLWSSGNRAIGGQRSLWPWSLSQRGVMCSCFLLCQFNQLKERFQFLLKSPFPLKTQLWMQFDCQWSSLLPAWISFCLLMGITYTSIESPLYCLKDTLCCSWSDKRANTQALRRIWGWEHSNSAPQSTKWLWEPWDFPGLTMTSVRCISRNETPRLSPGQWKSTHFLKRRGDQRALVTASFGSSAGTSFCHVLQVTLILWQRWTSQSWQKTQVLKRTT